MKANRTAAIWSDGNGYGNDYDDLGAALNIDTRRERMPMSKFHVQVDVHLQVPMQCAAKCVGPEKGRSTAVKMSTDCMHIQRNALREMLSAEI